MVKLYNNRFGGLFSNKSIDNLTLHIAIVKSEEEGARNICLYCFKIDSIDLFDQKPQVRRQVVCSLAILSFFDDLACINFWHEWIFN